MYWFSPLIKENSACAAIAQANLYNNDLPARSKFILLTKLHGVTLVLIEIQCLYNNSYCLVMKFVPLTKRSAAILVAPLTAWCW